MRRGRTAAVVPSRRYVIRGHASSTACGGKGSAKARMEHLGPVPLGVHVVLHMVAVVEGPLLPAQQSRIYHTTTTPHRSALAHLAQPHEGDTQGTALSGKESAIEGGRKTWLKSEFITL